MTATENPSRPVLGRAPGPRGIVPGAVCSRRADAEGPRSDGAVEPGRVPGHVPDQLADGVPDEVPEVEVWRPPRCPLDPGLVLRLAGHRRPAAVPPPIDDIARRMTARADELAAPAALLRTVRVARAEPPGATLVGGPAFSGMAVGRLLSRCPAAVAFVLTLGPELEAEVSALGDRREPLEAFLLDTAGWAAIEGAVRALRLELGGRARRLGWRVTHRLAPGYADWPLEEQRLLMGLFAGAPALVRLSEHGVLVPFKSITGVFGLAAGENPRRQPP